MYVNGIFGQLFIQGFYRSKSGRSRDIFIVYPNGFQDMVFKTMGNKPVNSFHGEMVNWEKQDMVFKTTGNKQ
jgi:hypothetical protein